MYVEKLMQLILPFLDVDLKYYDPVSYTHLTLPTNREV